MPRFAYVNGHYVPHARAAVHIEDRGYQFADGVYEMFAVVGGALADEQGHLERLGHSLGELKIAWPCSQAGLKSVMRELVRCNGLNNGALYLQITRGVAPRDFKFPKDALSTLVLTTRRLAPTPVKYLNDGIIIVTVPDQRWARRDIKSVGLLAQVLAKQAAAEQGAFEAWMVAPDGYVTEGSSSTAWIVTQAGALVTRKADHSILKGITGNSITALAAALGLTVEQRSFTVDEAMKAREALLTSATNYYLPVTRIDGQAIGDGKPGPMAKALRQAYLDYAQAGQDHQFHWSL